MTKSRIAAQMFTLREFCKTPEDLSDSLHRVKKIGYDAVQISGICPIGYSELKDILDDAGITCCATHIPYVQMKDDPENAVEDHRKIHCKYAAIGGIHNDARNAEGYARFAKGADEVGKRLASGGLYFGYHNHSFELENYGGRTGLAIIYEDSDPQYVKAEIDTYWIQNAGGDPAWWIRKLKGRVPLVHLKDMTVRDGMPIMAEVGEGNLNWPSIIDACKKAGVEWYIVEQDECERDPFESLEISLKNLRKMGIE